MDKMDENWESGYFLGGVGHCLFPKTQFHFPIAGILSEAIWYWHGNLSDEFGGYLTENEHICTI